MSALLNKIYSASPVCIQNIFVSAYGFYWKKRRFGGIFRKELAEFKMREKYSAESWLKYQEGELRKLLIHAFTTVPYYAGIFKEHGIKRRDLERLRLSDLPTLPVMEKETLRKHGETTLVSDIKMPGRQYFGSSGSTGTPTRILFSYPMHQRWSAAFEVRVRNWAGLHKDIPRGMIGGRRIVPEGNARAPYYRYNWFEKQTYFSAYHISPQTAADYVEGMRRFDVQYMTGYAMSNFFLARFIKQVGLKPPKMKAVVTSSEKLNSEMRELFYEVYGCRTFDSWSGVEACGLVSECEYGKLHVSPDVGIIEILDKSGKPVKSGEMGEVVCTGLLNYDQPLIRYRIGDLMRPGEGGCKCGRNLPVIEEIVGRVEDVVVGPDGRQMVRFHSIFIGISKIIEAQVIQWAVDDIEIRVVLEEKLSHSEEEVLKNRIKSQLGEVKVRIVEVQEIPLTRNGKFKAVISHVSSS